MNQIRQMTLATFINDSGLESIGENLYLETTSSGAPNETNPGLNGAGLLYQKFVETSNVNVAEELVSMIQTQRRMRSTVRLYLPPIRCCRN